jgi:hypothetical protein
MTEKPGISDAGLSICHRNCACTCILSIIAHFAKGRKTRLETRDLPTPHGAIPNAAREVCQRRTRSLPTPHAAIGISPCGVCELRLLKSVQKHAENAGFAMWRWHFGN